MQNEAKTLKEIPLFSYMGKRGKIIILSLLVITLITLIVMTFNAYKDNERIVYLKDIVLVLLLVSALSFIQYYFFQNIIKPIKNLHNNLKKVNSFENRVTSTANTSSGEEIDILVERINEALSTFNETKTKLVGDKKELETALTLMKYERKKLQSVLDCLPEALIVTNLSGNILYINSYAESLFRISRKDNCGKNIVDVLEKYDGVVNFLKEKRNSEKREIKYDIFLSDNGLKNERVFKAVYETVRNDNNKALGKALILIDNTQQAMADQMRNDFVSSVSHELRTPLTSIKAKAEMILDDEVEDKDMRIEFLNSIIDEVDRLGDLINNLLNISKIEVGSTVIEKSQVKLKKLLEDAYLMIEPQAAKKGIKLYKDIPEKLSASVELDKRLIQMAINNIAGNAIKYTQRGGSIFIEGEENENNVVITIRDTGIGIAEEDLPHIFEKFYRSNRKEVRACTGHGLGLSVVKQIVYLHGGEIFVESKIGEGSSFKITLPKVRGESFIKRKKI
ncbi:MAG: PAS domain-containing protein [Candidatus Schekmanbacteria bacterium]|nr:MAG: PAS domain-containing protein [Candidatus Schekmanbacteria bacterium]